MRHLHPSQSAPAFLLDRTVTEKDMYTNPVSPKLQPGGPVGIGTLNVAFIRTAANEQVAIRTLAPGVTVATFATTRLYGCADSRSRALLSSIDGFSRSHRTTA